MPKDNVLHCGKSGFHKLHTWWADGGNGKDALMRCTGLENDRPQPKRPPHKPERGSDVEEWLKKSRDEQEGNDAWYAIDDLLEDYRFRADAKLTMKDEVSKGDR
jgi:hypothetical protein